MPLKTTEILQLARKIGKERFGKKPPAQKEAHEASHIVGENGVYIIDEEGVQFLAKSERINGAEGAKIKMLRVIKELLDKERA